jgi:hypothetical protein
VKEYLLATSTGIDENLHEYSVRPDQGNCKLVQVCLTYLCLEDFGSISPGSKWRREWKDNPICKYAAREWPEHARDHLDNEDIQRLTKTLLDPSMSNNFLVWTQNAAEGLEPDYIYSRPPYEKLVAGSTPLHWSCLLALPKLCAWLLEENPAMISKSSLIGTPLHCAIL